MALITLPFTVTGQQLEFSQPVLAEHAVGSIGATFSFSTEWATLTIRTATFATFDASYDVALVADACTVPGEALTASSFRVSVRGSDGTHVLTTTVARVGVEPSLVGGGTPAPPTPSVYDQLVAQATAAATDAAQAQSAAMAAQASATAAASSAATINDIRSDSYNPNIKVTKYCQTDMPWTANNEYMQGCTLYNDTLYVGAAPISGNGKGSIYRFPNFSNPLDGILKSDARIELNNCTHPNCLATYNNLIFAVDGILNRHITTVDINTFTETAGINIGWGSLTDICIRELFTSGNYASLAIFGSLIDANRVLCVYCVYDKSTNVATNFSYKTAPQFQHNSLRQGAAMISNTRFLVCSYKTWDSDHLYVNSSYLLAGNPVEGAPYTMIPIPWEPCYEVEDCFIDSKDIIYFNCSNRDIYILGPAKYFVNQNIEPTMNINRGSSTEEFVPSTNVLLESGEIVGSRMLVGFRVDRKLINNATYSASLCIKFAMHDAMVIPISINNNVVTGSIYFHASVGWCYAFIKGNIDTIIDNVDISTNAILVREFDLQIGDAFYSTLSSLPSDWKVTGALFEFSLSN